MSQSKRRKIATVTTVPYVPPEIIYEILTFVPLNGLFRIVYVCKRWWVCLQKVVVANPEPAPETSDFLPSRQVLHKALRHCARFAVEWLINKFEFIHFPSDIGFVLGGQCAVTLKESVIRMLLKNGWRSCLTVINLAIEKQYDKIAYLLVRTYPEADRNGSLWHSILRYGSHMGMVEVCHYLLAVGVPPEVTYLEIAAMNGRPKIVRLFAEVAPKLTKRIPYYYVRATQRNLHQDTPIPLFPRNVLRSQYGQVPVGTTTWNPLERFLYVAPTGNASIHIVYCIRTKALVKVQRIGELDEQGEGLCMARHTHLSDLAHKPKFLDSFVLTGIGLARPIVEFTDWTFHFVYLPDGIMHIQCSWSSEGRLEFADGPTLCPLMYPAQFVVYWNSRNNGIRDNAYDIGVSLHATIVNFIRLQKEHHDGRALIDRATYTGLCSTHGTDLVAARAILAKVVPILFQAATRLPIPITNLAEGQDRTAILNSLCKSHWADIPDFGPGQTDAKPYISAPSGNDRFVSAPMGQCIACLDFVSMYPNLMCGIPALGPLHGTIQKLIADKQRARGANRRVCKLIVNSLYGSFGSRSFIATNGRTMMYEIMRRGAELMKRAIAAFKGVGRVIYSHTDSLYVVGERSAIEGRLREFNTSTAAHFPELLLECMCEKIFVMRKNVVVRSGVIGPSGPAQTLFTGWMFHSVSVCRVVRRALRSAMSTAMNMATDMPSLLRALNRCDRLERRKLQRLQHPTIADLVEYTDTTTNVGTFACYDRSYGIDSRRPDLRATVGALQRCTTIVYFKVTALCVNDQGEAILPPGYVSWGLVEGYVRLSDRLRIYVSAMG